MKAVLKTGGKQYLVAKGDSIIVEKLEGEPGTKIQFTDVLFVEKDDMSIVTGADLAGLYTVTGVIKAQGKGKKLIIYKKRRRKGYERRMGHRQLLTTVAIEDIVAAKA